MKYKKPFTEEYVQINGIKQYFLHYPSPQKEVVIFLHGGPGSPTSAFAYNLMEHWDFCSVVYYDQRGTGKTLKMNKAKASDLTIEILLADLKETVEYVKSKYQTDRVILLGQSWGSVLGTQYTLRYPEDISCYIGNGQIVNMRKGFDIAFDELKETLERKGATKDLAKLISLDNFSNLASKDLSRHLEKFQKIQSKYGHSVNILELLKIGFKSPVTRISDFYYFLRSPKLTEGLWSDYLADYSIWDIADYKTPVYYVLGRDDWQVPSTFAAEYFEKINAPHKGLYWIENAGHATDVDSPKDFSTIVREIVLGL